MIRNLVVSYHYAMSTKVLPSSEVAVYIAQESWCTVYIGWFNYYVL